MKRFYFIFFILLSIKIIAAEGLISHNKQLYLSAKYHIIPPYSTLGGNVEVAYVNRVFMGLDFGGGINYKDWDSEMGWGFSLGKQIKPNDWLQVIPGGSIGCWILFDFYSSGGFYYYNEEHDKYYYEGGHGEIDISVVFGGPFIKLLFGKNKFFAEFSQRFLFGSNMGENKGSLVAYQAMLGFTYIHTSSKKVNYLQ